MAGTYEGMGADVRGLRERHFGLFVDARVQVLKHGVAKEVDVRHKRVASTPHYVHAHLHRNGFTSPTPPHYLHPHLPPQPLTSWLLGY